MKSLTIDFSEFFAALWPERSPFPWQRMLAERGADGKWPEAIDLPTASGKTACLDAAVFSLASQADLPLVGRSAPRRIWFVVDRRIVVDEAFERASELARRLKRARQSKEKSVLGVVAERLCAVSGTEQPLAVARLRGGAWRDDSWARVPSQPAIICSTVDQLGSALLFRAYGHSELTASIWAGLAAHDSLILLDEAHCAVPFLQTLRSIREFRQSKWAEHPIQTPFQFTIMSATPPADIDPEKTFPGAAHREEALNHPLLQQRIVASKPAELIVEKDGAFVAEAVRRACAYGLEKDKRRIGVMVNRVATAEEIATQLAEKLRSAAEVVLLTGRMRPLDRDKLVERWKEVLKSDSKVVPEKPVILVTTQCLEVGADFSFDALVTECASLDALRQRFGRLNRLGMPGAAPGVILIREHDTKQTKGEDSDPVYGTAIRETWRWLNEAGQKRDDGMVDFGIAAMDSCVAKLQAAEGGEKGEVRGLSAMLAPVADAPVLLPAHLDLLCQTAPRPVPEPEVALFLHGKGNHSAEARVVFRADLFAGEATHKEQDHWSDLLSLLPPSTLEMFTVPLYRLRNWLVAQNTGANLETDVQGELEPPSQREELKFMAPTDFILWRGGQKSRRTRDVREICPGDVVVLPAFLGLKGLGQAISQPTGVGMECLDLAEQAIRQSRGLVVLRLNLDLVEQWVPPGLLKQAAELIHSSESDNDEIFRLLQDWALALGEPGGWDLVAGSRPLPPAWLLETLTDLCADGFTKEQHPQGGWILFGKERRLPVEHGAQVEPDAEDATASSSGQKEVGLAEHTGQVVETVGSFFRRCLDESILPSALRAAEDHDLGKLDARFQLLLHCGDEFDADKPLAKSARLPAAQRRRIQVQEDARLPEGFRHEFLSMQLADYFGLLPDEPSARDLALHLVASHHGYARPFAPVVPDSGSTAGMSLRPLGLDAALTPEMRNSLMPAAHSLDSGVSDRFWRLTRRFGWWGLAYVEAVFRLSDWFASRFPETGEIRPLAGRSAHGTRSLPATGDTEMALDALDGANPLGFLAALGVLRLLDDKLPKHECRLYWSQRYGAWRPQLQAVVPLEREELLAVLCQSGLDLNQMFSPALLDATEEASPKNKQGEARWKDKLMFPVTEFRRFCRASTLEPNGASEFAATWAGETLSSDDDGVEIARKTRFDFTAGQQAFIAMVRELKVACSLEDLRRTLFDGWLYRSPSISMRWDPIDEKRQYALQAVDPTNGSANPALADLGANFLAVEALPLFPLIPDYHASQSGFRREAGRFVWRWPLWTKPLRLDSVRSVLTLPFDNPDAWPQAHRIKLGLGAVFESAIVQPSGRYRCFTPARSV